MSLLAGGSIAAIAVIGIWVAKTDRDHPLRRPALAGLGLLCMLAMGALLWDSPYSGKPIPLPSKPSAPATSRSPAFTLLLIAFLVSLALSFWPGDNPALGLLRVLALSLILGVALLFLLVTVFLVMWGNQGGAISPLTAELTLSILICAVSIFGLARHSP